MTAIDSTTLPAPAATVRTPSMFEAAMGSDFGRLHPELQRRFGLSVAGGEACIGRGTMSRIWHGAALARPFLKLGAWRNVLVPAQGENVPFCIENYPYLDSYGRETVTFVRTFAFPRRRPGRFDATMILGRNGGIVDYLGTHQHLAVDLELSADEHGGLVIRSGGQRFYEGLLGFQLPELVNGHAELHETYDEERQVFTIDVRVVNRRFGPLCGYTGTFVCEYVDVARRGVPAHVKPVREELRE